MMKRIESRRARAARVLAVAVAAALLACAVPAQAQLRLPGGALPSLPGLPGGLGRLQTQPLAESVPAALPLQQLRQRTLRELLREHRDVLEADPAGEPVRRAELLLISPAQSTVDAALALGFALLREQTLEGLDTRSVVLQAPRGLSTAEGLERLRALDPQLEVDFNHVYTRSSSSAADGRGSGAPATGPAPEGTPPALRRVGLIDSGIDRSHPALQNAAVLPWGCAGTTIASAHGTAIASLLVGQDALFVGVAPRAVLYAADVYCGLAYGGSAEAVSQALAWMARERVAVINISLVGPPNRLLERAVQALAARGHLIVAAVGNDGPAAPPLYPASYPSVIGVTGVSTARRPLPEAAQGPQVSFAAPGADLAVARSGARGYGIARGTSYAAPIVAGLLSQTLTAPDPAAAQRALSALTQLATDLGAPGRDAVFGWGLVGEHARIAPDRVQASAREQP